MMTRFIRNSRGQVAIFIALLFQVLFLFFAMIVNVGLLIHHKINLQNSVDLAAFYGAQKQGEVLNAISHVNYQIRQSWKLLVWRHRVLGSAGAEAGIALPLGKLTSNAGVNEVIAGSGNNVYESLYRLPRFCIAYEPHEVFGSNGTDDAENTCKRSYQATASTTLPNANVLQIPGFFSFGAIVGNAIRNAVMQAQKRCANVGSLNYVIGGKFIAGYILDSQERALLINHLATGISAQQDDFFELSGDSAKIGLEKTLRNNLTDANRSTLQFKMLNGLGLGSCRAAGAQVGAFIDDTAPPWLVPVEVYPVWRYSDCSYEGSGQTTIKSTARQLDSLNRPDLASQADPSLQTQVNALLPVLQPKPTLIGFEKDPWCMSYIGVKATTKPKIPFMPLSEIELTAEAYAKPFGGRVGPWYFKNWQPSDAGQNRINATANTHQPSMMLEPNGPIRVTNVSGITKIDGQEWVPNIARFVGDGSNLSVNPGGYAVERVLAYFHRAIRNWETTSGPGYYAPLLKPGALYAFNVVTEPKASLTYYDGIGTDFNTSDGQGLDQLSWSKDLNGAPRLRLLEIAGIAPNLFDLAYYSIEPDFYNTYFKKIEASITGSTGTHSGWKSGRRLLGDIGSRFDGSEQLKAFNIFDQIRVQRDVGGPNSLDTENSMPYVVKNPAHLLNSWSVDSLRDYRTNTNKFGKCLSPDSAASNVFEQPLVPSTPGNCVDGGRVGFSVKMVGGSYLNAGDLSLGGDGASPGPLRNPPPSDW